MPKFNPIEVTAKGDIKTTQTWCLINNGGIPMWMQGTKKDLQRAGLIVMKEEQRKVSA